ncbi:hypothetical protein RJ640_024034 [Escallonia rubra]|uniref:Uncharacterized protein n=1 Tax=Escallonia rubra TaxID=112253 RepID=A0AA88S3G7_9ASTE|nr:hypothetical protein RJ640_024034 [Escallonia rubra]
MALSVCWQVQNMGAGQFEKSKPYRADNKTEIITERATDTKAWTTAGAITTPALSSDELFCDSAAGPSAGPPAGADVGGAGGDRNGDGAAADPGAGAGTGPLGAGDGDTSGAGPGAGDGDFPNKSAGSSTLSTVNMQRGVASTTVEATRDESTPVSRVTESPAVFTFKSYFPAPFVAKVERDQLGIRELAQIRHSLRLERLIRRREQSQTLADRRFKNFQHPGRRELLDRLGVRRVELGAGGGRAEADLTAFEIRNVHEPQFSGGVAGGLVQCGGEDGALGDLVELGGVVVVEEDVEAEGVLDDGRRVVSGERRHGGVVEDEDGDGVAGVDLVGELRLGEVLIEDAVVSDGGDGDGREGEEEEVQCAHGVKVGRESRVWK